MRKFASLFAMLMLFSVLAFAQTRTVTGVVRDNQGIPFLLPLLQKREPEMPFRLTLMAHIPLG